MTAPDISELSMGLHHNQTLALQKYLLLHSQHEHLRNHLDALRSPLAPTHLDPYTSTSSIQSSPYSSRSPSTSRSRSRRSSMGAPRPGSSGASMTRCSSMSLETVLDESTLQELAEEEAKLFDVNEGIKRTLTELLNCNGVKGDRAFRSWVLSRLMEAEKELRVCRRRRSQPGYEYS